MAYTKYPGMDEEFKFPPAVMQAIADSDEIAEKIAEGAGATGIVIEGILAAGQTPPKPGVWARRLA